MKKMKNILLVLVCLAVMGIASIAAVAAEHKYGDLDVNGEITVRDSLKALQHASNIVVLDEAVSDYGDVNEDGVVNATDALQILEYCVQKRADFKANEPEFSGHVWIAGDSIAAPTAKNGDNPRYGWGEVISEYFKEGVTVHNYAVGGTSSKSFSECNEYQTIMNGLKPGDVFFIAFGHNDMKADERYTDGGGESNEEGSYKWYLKEYYIDPALKRGAFPIVMSSVVRCTGDFSTIYQQSHYSHANSAIEIGEEYCLQNIYVPTIDLFNITYAEYKKLGKTDALQFHAAADANSEDDYDTTHYNEHGARWCSQLILSELMKLDLNICEYIDADKVIDPRVTQ